MQPQREPRVLLNCSRFRCSEGRLRPQGRGQGRRAPLPSRTAAWWTPWRRATARGGWRGCLRGRAHGWRFRRPASRSPWPPSRSPRKPGGISWVDFGGESYCCSLSLFGGRSVALACSACCVWAGQHPQPSILRFVCRPSDTYSRSLVRPVAFVFDEFLGCRSREGRSEFVVVAVLKGLRVRVGVVLLCVSASVALFDEESGSKRSLFLHQELPQKTRSVSSCWSRPRRCCCNACCVGGVLRVHVEDGRTRNNERGRTVTCVCSGRQSSNREGIQYQYALGCVYIAFTSQKSAQARTPYPPRLATTDVSDVSWW